MSDFGPGQGVPPTFGFDPTRPRSAQFWMSPELRRPSWARPSNVDPKSNVPGPLQGDYPGTPAYPTEAGAGERYGFSRDWMQRMLSFYGAPGPNVAQLDLVDWNNEANMFAARDSIKYQLETLCKVDWTQTPWPSFQAMWEARGGFSDGMWETFRALQSKFCPSFSMRDEPPPAQVVTTTGTEVLEAEAPPEAPPQRGTALGGEPAEAPAEVPEAPVLYQEPRRKPNLGYWLGGSALILAVIGGAWYLSQRKPRRRNPRRKQNPEQEENPTAVEHAYEHGFMAGLDAGEKAFKEKPCSCNPAPVARSSRQRKPRKRNYGGTAQDPSIQYDILDVARTSLLEDMPGATWEPPAKTNPKRRKKKTNPKRKTKDTPTTTTKAILSGSTFPFRGILKEHGWQWDDALRCWIKVADWADEADVIRSVRSYGGIRNRGSFEVRLEKAPKRSNPKGAVCGRRYGKLTAQKRARLPSSAFGLPRSRQYPMPDSSHAALAKGRAKQQLKRRKLSRANYEKIVRKADRILRACGGAR